MTNKDSLLQKMAAMDDETLAEYLEDYGSPETRQKGYAQIYQELARIPRDRVRRIAEENIQKIRSSNQRDFRF